MNANIDINFLKKRIIVFTIDLYKKLDAIHRLSNFSLYLADNDMLEEFKDFLRIEGHAYHFHKFNTLINLLEVVNEPDEFIKTFRDDLMDEHYLKILIHYKNYDINIKNSIINKIIEFNSFDSDTRYNELLKYYTSRCDI